MDSRVYDGFRVSISMRRAIRSRRPTTAGAVTPPLVGVRCDRGRRRTRSWLLLREQRNATSANGWGVERCNLWVLHAEHGRSSTPIHEEQLIAELD